MHMSALALFPRALASLAVALALVLLTQGASLARDDLPVPPAGTPAKKPIPAKKSSAVRPQTTELSPAALGMDPKSRGYEPGDQKSDLKVPDHIQIGNNTLHFDAKKNDPTPPVGFEANGEAVINKAPAEPALAPSYLGLRLTTPIR